MSVLFVDDSQERFYKISVALAETDAVLYQAKTMDEALKLLSTEKYNYIFLDYDLGENAGSGRGVAEYIARNIKEFIGCTIVVHSFNPAGAEHMFNEIRDAAEQSNNVHSGITVHLAPLGYNDKNFLKRIGLL